MRRVQGEAEGEGRRGGKEVGEVGRGRVKGREV